MKGELRLLWKPEQACVLGDISVCRRLNIPFASSQGAQIEILCTHQVRFAITCLATSGPTNISAASVYNNDYG